jgi:hypothetical protein
MSKMSELAAEGVTDLHSYLVGKQEGVLLSINELKRQKDAALAAVESSSDESQYAYWSERFNAIGIAIRALQLLAADNIVGHP